MKVVPFLLLAVMSVQCSGLDNYCGRKLSNTLAQFCKREKKSADDEYDYNEVVWPSWPLLARRYAKALSQPGRGKRGGVVEECCHEPCSFSELLLYCPE